MAKLTQGSCVCNHGSCVPSRVSRSYSSSSIVPDSTSIEHVVDHLTARGDATPATPTSTSHSPSLTTSELSVPLAVIGWSHRFPGDAATSDGFWNMLCEGRTAHGRIPRDRFDVDAFYHPNHKIPGTVNVTTGHFLTQDISAFDAPFFGIQPTEAAAMDPQQRLMLETAYHAFENAGLKTDTLVGSNTSVHIGAFSHDYEVMHARDPESEPPYLATGIGGSMLANRISWFFDLRGESMVIDTACSSSLSCLHLASRALQTGDSNIALVGGVNIMITPDSSFFHHSGMGFFSPDGRSYSFDERANGYAKGEGTAVVILKRFDDAVNDGDTIRAVIAATGTNQDGRTPGITQPSAKAQELNMRTVHQRYRINPDDIQYLEAHGTGTQLGDPVECAAIAATFERSARNPLIVGTVKPNIGHLEAVAGLAGLIKAIMALERGLIPPIALYQSPNPRIDAGKWNLEFPRKVTAWPVEGPRTAAISSFGYGGSNVYVVLHDALHFLEQNGVAGRHNTVKYPPIAPKVYGNVRGHQPKNVSGPRPRLFFWSGADETSVRKMVGIFRDHLTSLEPHDRGEHDYLRDLSFTLSDRRTTFPWKTCVVADSIGMLVENLDEKKATLIRSSGPPALVFVFTGQGAQWFAMGRELIYHSIFLESLQKAEDVLRTLEHPLSPREELLRDKASSRIDEPLVSQTLCTILQLALVDLLTNEGIVPIAVIGHSSGEIAAAYCAGGLSFESAVRTAFYRGYHSSNLVKRTDGECGMISVQLPPDRIQSYIDSATSSCGGTLVVACENCPQNVTLSGNTKCIEHVAKRMEQEGIFARRLRVPLAYHSPQMDSISSIYHKSLKGIQARETISPEGSFPCPVMFSTVTGKEIDKTDLADPAYWVQNMTSTVKFSLGLRNLLTFLQSDRLENMIPHRTHVLEIGPGAALKRPVSDIVSSLSQAPNTVYDSILERHTSAVHSTLRAVGSLRCNGVDIDLGKVNNSMSGGNTYAKQLVDLPSYPFNHSHVYWTESRLNKNFRTRSVARHELLGVPTTDWNPLAPSWDHRLLLTENPWIMHHRIDASHIYPAAGMIAMVIEAARQLTDVASEISGYHLTHLRIVQTLKVSDSSDGTEVKLCFHRPKDTFGPSNEHDFTLYTYVDQSWMQCFSGTVAVELATGHESLSRLQFESRRMIEVFTRHEFLPPSCSESIAEHEFYRNLAQHGYEYGPTHQTVQNLHYSEREREVCGQIALDSWTKKCTTDPKSTRPHVIHPTDLDGILQLTLAAFSRAGTQALPIMLPTKCESLWISNKLLNRQRDTKLHTSVRNTFTGLREADFNIVALDEERVPVVVMEGWREMAVTMLDTVPSNQEEIKRLCYTTVWDFDIEQMSPPEIRSLCETRSQQDCRDHLDTNILEFLSMYYLSGVVGLVESGRPLKGFGAHTEQYVNWAKRTYDPQRLEQLMRSVSVSQSDMENEHKREAILDAMASTSPECQLTAYVGKHVARLLQGELDPLEVVYGQAFIREFYRGPILQRNYDQIKSYLTLLAHKNPNLKIVEIGAGTGSGTISILPALIPSTEEGGSGDGDGYMPLPKFDKYDFTDVSPQFFEHARPLLAQYVDRFNFVTLNIEEDPVKQGFQEGTYDLVFASLVLHATSDLSKCLQNTRKLLKPGGKLVLIELTTTNCARIHFIFGLLPGWWLSTEEIRKSTPTLTAEQWDTVLRENGFTGTDISMADSDDPAKATSHMIVATACEESARNGVTIQHPLLVANTDSGDQRDVAHAILSTLGCPDEGNIIDLSDITASACSDRFCIVIAELEQSWLEQIDALGLRRLQSLFGQADRVIWATCGAGHKVTQPARDLVTGLGRNVRSESSHASFTHLAFDENDDTRRITSCICSVYKQNLTLPVEKCEDLYTTNGGRLSIGRVFESDKLNRLISIKSTRCKPQKTTVQEQRGRRLALGISTPGLLDTLHFADDASGGTPLGELDVEVLPAAVGLNFRDVLTALGKLASKNLGLEFAGTVNRAGVQSGFRPGDRVLGMTPNGAFKTHIRAPAAAVIKIDDQLPFEEAASIPMAWSTAYYCLVSKANLQSGESILIHSGAGGFGQAALQIAKHLGANIFVTVGNDDKRQYVTEKYGIPASQVFSSRTTEFADSIMEITEGNGVDVIINSLTGNLMRASWSIIAPLGRFIEIGKTDIMSDRGLPTQEFLNSVSFISIDLIVLMHKAPKVVKNIMNAAVDLYKSLSTDVSRTPQTFTAGEMETAFRWMQGGANIGKAVVTFHPQTHILATPNLEAAYRFSSDSTYVIAGGFGGVGGAIVKWMVSRGARYFLIPSRSGQESTNAQKLLQEVARDDVVISGPRCDISKGEQVKNVIEQARGQMPPIKGCIQATAVLSDALFLNMTYDAWKLPIQPKVQGTWNLHEHLPRGMDFFVTLSSIASIIGSRGQANYAAGNAYEDSLTRYRQGMGEKACTINIGPVRSVGKVVEMGYEKDLVRDGFEGIEIEELLTLVEYACDPAQDHSDQRLTGTRIITGLGGVHKAAAREKGEIYWLNRPFTSCLHNHHTQSPGRGGPGDADAASVSPQTSVLLQRDATSDPAAIRIVLHALRTKLSRALSISLDDVEASMPIHAFGVDSLVSLEIRYWFMKEIKAGLAVFEIMGASDLNALCTLAWTKSAYRPEASTGAESSP